MVDLLIFSHRRSTVSVTILPEWHHPNLASRVLALNLKRLSRDWERYYGHPTLLAETFVDPARFRGTCYQAAGWQVLGTTRGFTKRGSGYVTHAQPKILLVRPLRPQALSSLRASFLPPSTLQEDGHPKIPHRNYLWHYRLKPGKSRPAPRSHAPIPPALRLGSVSTTASPAGSSPPFAPLLPAASTLP